MRPYQVNRRLRKGWFRIPGLQDGERTIEEQLKGLHRLMVEVQTEPGKVIVDLGAAEGLIGATLHQLGARKVYGAEINQASVEVSGKLHDRNVVDVVHQDLNATGDVRQLLADVGPYDVCLLLGILQKLKRPVALVDAVMQTFPCPLLVVRLPSYTPGFVKDHRSGNCVIDISGHLLLNNYELKWVEHGHYNEWTGYFYRRQA